MERSHSEVRLGVVAAHALGVYLDLGRSKSDRPPLNDSVSAASEPPHEVEEGEELRVEEARVAAAERSEGVSNEKRILKNVSCLAPAVFLHYS